MRDVTQQVFRRLTAQQQEAASAAGAVLTVSGAGTGKTSTLTAGAVHRLVERGIAPERLLLVTFTNKAAAEMAGRLERPLRMAGIDLPRWVGTFHSLSCRQLRRSPDIAGLEDRFSIMDEAGSKRMMEGLMDRAGIDKSEHKPADVLSFIGFLKDNLVTPEMVEDGIVLDPMAPGYALESAPTFDNPEMPELVARLYPAFQAELRLCNHADFGDLLLWPTVTALHDDAYRARIADPFSAVMGDEYQDVNQAQATWFRLMGQRHGEVFAVGDDAQSIFGWRGADVRYIRRFQHDFPQAKTVLLEQNFRSGGHILAAANAVIAGDPDSMPKTLFTTRGDGEKLCHRSYATADEEARSVASLIAERVRNGANPSSIAVIYRANAVASLFENALLAQKQRCRVFSGTQFFQRAEVRNAVALLRLAEFGERRQSDPDFLRVVNTPSRGIGEKTLRSIEDAARGGGSSLFEAAAVMRLPPQMRRKMDEFIGAVAAARNLPDAGIAERIRFLVTETGLLDSLKGEDERLAHLDQLLTLAAGEHDIDDFLERAALGAERPQNEEAVNLSTLHGAKGLEFDTVYLVAWDSAVFPNRRADQNEERRLAYVGLTRARHELIISSACSRWGEASHPSGFLREIPAGHIRREQPGAQRGYSQGGGRSGFNRDYGSRFGAGYPVRGR